MISLGILVALLIYGYVGFEYQDWLRKDWPGHDNLFWPGEAVLVALCWPVLMPVDWIVRR